MTEAAARILVADDQPQIRELLGLFLRKHGFTVDEAVDGTDALRLVEQHDFDAVVSDIDMPGLSGLTLLRRIRARDLDLPVILVTGQPSIESAAKAVEYGAMRYLMKPIDLKEVVKVVEYAVQLRRMAALEREAAALLGQQSGFAGDRAGLEERFAGALDRLWVAFQPIVCPSTREVYAYEALMRSDEASMSSPLVLVNAAERLGRLFDLGRLIRTRTAEAWQAALEHSLLFVNLHPQDLLDADLFAGKGPLADMAPRVVLEVTERASLEGVRDLTERVAALRRIGFRLAVDDMGAGYSGLSTLARVQPDVVKLDMSLIRHVDTDVTKQRLVRSMAQVCADMGIAVIAEGVETSEERDSVIDLGCDLLQGYLYAKPARPFIQPDWGDRREAVM